MTTLLLKPTLSNLFRPQVIGASLGLGMAAYTLSPYSPFREYQFVKPYKMDGPGSGGSAVSGVFSPENYKQNAPVPIIKEGKLNESAVRQISSGSIIGLCAGLVVSTFSKPLALILGLLVVGIQYASSKGINIIPYNRLQQYFTSLDVRSAVQDNVAFKISFGTTFALAAFMQF